MRVYLDLETYSSTDLRKAGVYRYVADPTFRILLAGWSVDGGPVRVDEDTSDLRDYMDAGATLVAHNANFDRVCLGDSDPEQWECTQAIAGELGLPQGLAALSAALGGEQKDSAGSRLIRLFAMPNRYGLRHLPTDYPAEWATFVEYCRQDVATLVDVDSRMGGFPTDMERRVYWMDQRVNDRGIRIDRDLARAAVEANDDNHMVQELRVSELTGILNPNSNVRLLRWLQEAGLKVKDTSAATVQDLLTREGLDPDVREVLKLRQDLALVAVKKYPAALSRVSPDGRLRGGFKFFGAHTGRWSGRGVQPHNLPRYGFAHPADEEAAILNLTEGDHAASADTLKKLVRALLVGPFTVVDYGAIEARAIAWLANERWALRAFRDGRDIYSETAARMGGLTRAQGKVAVLALGFGGGVNSLKVMAGAGIYYGPDGKPRTYGSIGEANQAGASEFTEDEYRGMVDQWRSANPMIVDLWAKMGEAFFSGGPVGRHLVVERAGSDRRLRLPSGRAIVYRDCRWDMGERGMRASFVDPRGRTETYGGRLAENATQAVARDILAEALVRLNDRGYPVVAHVHDEAVIEGTYPVEEIVRVMCEPPSWAAGLPIAAVGAHCDRYRKL